MKYEDISTVYFLRDPNVIGSEETETILKWYKNKGRSWFLGWFKKNGILPFGSHVLSLLHVDQKFWSDIHDEYFQRNRVIRKAVDELFVGFSQNESIQVAVYENFGALLRSSSCLGCFSSGDVDLTASRRDREIIDKNMMSHGFKVVSRRTTVSDRIMMSYLNEGTIKNGLWVNLTWKPIARRFVNNHHKIGERLAEARRTAGTIEDTSIRVLNADELMYFCMLHIALGHYYTNSPAVRLYVDIDRLARSCEINWDKIRKWAEEDGMGIRVDVVMEISNLLLKTPYSNRRNLRSNEKNSFEKLMRYVYNKSTGELILRSSRLEKMQVDLLSDGKNLLNALIGRIV